MADLLIAALPYDSYADILRSTSVNFGICRTSVFVFYCILYETYGHKIALQKDDALV